MVSCLRPGLEVGIEVLIDQPQPNQIRDPTI